MNRDEFREAVFARDGGRCVFCGAPAQDAHHLLERRLWPDGGYHPDNGIAVCAACHLDCERTLRSVEDGRAAAGIAAVLLPDHFERDATYDKWGNVILSDGRRSPGELFHDPSVQTALAAGGVLDRFTPYVKYPRTYHLPWSHPNHRNHPTGSSDRFLADVDHFAGDEVVITEKMDGENTTIYCDHVHARAIDGASHKSQGWVRQFAATIGHELPDGFRVCGENLYARHSIRYADLPSYFLGFAVWERDRCLGWDDTLEWFGLLGVTPVRELFRGLFDVVDWRSLAAETERRSREGYVVRRADTFRFPEFKQAVAKHVRPNHLQTPARWSSRFEKNLLADT